MVSLTSGINETQFGHLVLLLIVVGGCSKATVNNNAASAMKPKDAVQVQENRAVAAHSGEFDARLEADALANYWGSGAEI